MKKKSHDVDVAEYYLKPGYLYVTREPTLITTILGSCVSICLFDPATGIGGMNHYLLPDVMRDEPPSTRFGSVSIRELVKGVMEYGARKTHLGAHVTGGASIPNNPQSRLVADLNVEGAYLLLAQLSIPVKQAQTGGHQGRKVFFRTDTGEIRVEFVSAEILPVEERGAEHPWKK